MDKILIVLHNNCKVKGEIFWQKKFFKQNFTAILKEPNEMETSFELHNVSTVIVHNIQNIFLL